MLVKHSKRTIRRPCHRCGSTDLYWAHDTDKPFGDACTDCGCTGGWVLMNKDGTAHACTAGHVGMAPPTATTSVTAEPTPTAKPEPKPTATGYLPRFIHEDLTDVEMLSREREAGSAVLLYGPPGTGKTALAAAAFDDLVTVVCGADTERSDLEGSWTQNPDGTFSWHDGPVTVAAEAGRPLLVDEINLASPSVLTDTLYPLMDGRGRFTVKGNPARGEIVAKPGFVVIGAANPNVPGGRFSEALLSRFTVQVEVQTDWTLASKLGISARFVKVAKNLALKQRSDEIDWSPQLREGLAWRDTKGRYDEAFAWRTLITGAPEDARQITQSVIAAATGVTYEPLRLGDGR